MWAACSDRQNNLMLFHWMATGSEWTCVSTCCCLNSRVSDAASETAAVIRDGYIIKKNEHSIRTQKNILTQTKAQVRVLVLFFTLDPH